MTSSWLSRLVKRFRPCHPIRRTPTQSLHLLALEDRLQPAAFAEAGTALNLLLGTGEKVDIVSTGPTYTLALTGGTWSGTDTANETGNGTSKLTVTSPGIAAFTTGIAITDSGSAGGDAVTFDASQLVRAYANNFTIDLTHSSAGAGTPGLAFTGHTTFASGVGLMAAVNGDIVVNAGGGINMAGGMLSLSATGTNAPLTLNGGILDTTGNVTLRATGAVTEAVGVTINTGGTVDLSADVTAAGAGDDGTGTLTLNGNVYGASITLRGADENIAPTATVGSATTVAPAVSSFASGLNNPLGLAFDASGNLFVANFGSLGSGTTVSEYSSSGALINASFASGLSGPGDVAFDASGNLYVANAGGTTVSEFSPSGTLINASFASGLIGAYGLAFDAGGNLFVANAGGTTVSEFGPSGILINASFASGLNRPEGLALDASGNLYVANDGGTTVSEFGSSGTLINTSFASGLNGPSGVAFDASGNLYVANASGTTVSEFSPAGTLINTSFVSGLNQPAGLAFDASGNLFITDLNTVSRVTSASVATTSVTIQSSVSSRPMVIGGTNNAAVVGINLTSAELARIVTTTTGTVTIGDANQTGNITFVGATTATTAGAATHVVQSAAGAGQIILDNANGTALNGNGGTVTLTPGTGQLMGTLATTDSLISSAGFTATGLTLNLGLHFVPSPGQPLALVANSGSPITGAFTNLAPGGSTSLSFGGTANTFAVSYTGGAGRDLVLTDTTPPPAAPPTAPAAPPVFVPSVSVAFGPQGEVIEVVDSTGLLTQYDSTGAHALIGGVRSVSVAFGPQGEVIDVVDSRGMLTQYDSTGGHVLIGGVRSVSIAFGPQGEVVDIVDLTGRLTQYDSTGAHVLIGGVRSVSVAFGPRGEVVEIVDSTGLLTQYDATGAHAIIGGARSVSVTFGPQGVVAELIDSMGLLTQYDASGIHPLGVVV